MAAHVPHSMAQLHASFPFAGEFCKSRPKAGIICQRGLRLDDVFLTRPRTVAELGLQAASKPEWARKPDPVWAALTTEPCAD